MVYSFFFDSYKKNYLEKEDKSSGWDSFDGQSRWEFGHSKDVMELV